MEEENEGGGEEEEEGKEEGGEEEIEIRFIKFLSRHIEKKIKRLRHSYKSERCDKGP